ncbi:DNA-processing protein DprA [Halomonas halocynthiae]|uniref:DNA-processing protein DprA n=1 Tax=Halomonas halocynthiae TaxID=176290 RepID=UPI0003FC5F5C|nr:DNA-processing protein DprA [Halomonas halocynthiae]
MTLGAREWLLLSQLPRLGVVTLAGFAEARLDWPGGWLARLPHEAAQTLRLALDHPSHSTLASLVEAQLAWCRPEAHRYLLYPGHASWPRSLSALSDPPAVLWAQGDLAALEPPRLAMVGTRRATREGLHNAASFSQGLVEQGFCVVSGMALGIDGAAQRAALEAGGCSIGVLGCGVDVIYPARHRSLYEQLGRPGQPENGRGLLLSEHPPGTQAHPSFFPRRNRIVTGMSLGVLVVEAAERSGSLISARLAGEQGREVFAMPGSIHNPEAGGCLRLIREGAVLVRDVDDMVAELPAWALTLGADQALACSSGGQASFSASDNSTQDPLLGLLSATPVPMDVLVELSGLASSECQRQLIMLALDGVADQVPGGWVRLPTRS